MVQPTVFLESGRWSHLTSVILPSAFAEGGSGKGTGMGSLAFALLVLRVCRIHDPTAPVAFGVLP